ncbi:MAG TPA: hypothetical protein VE990_14545 [Acidimicrobiales bacterium]|nr:hypothetical protein [Acidimicrobiales bacterium]
MDIEEFYAADERRRSSEEFEYGQDWHDAAGVRYELSWVVDTGELYVMREPSEQLVDFFDGVFTMPMPTSSVTVGLLGVVPDRRQLDEALAGWQEEMSKPDSVSWLIERLHQSGVRPKRNPAG